MVNPNFRIFFVISIIMKHYKQHTVMTKMINDFLVFYMHFKNEYSLYVYSICRSVRMHHLLFIHIYECCTVIYENYKLLLTLSSAMRFSNKGPSATFRYTKYTSKVNIESMCCKLMVFLFQSVTSCYLNFSI